MKDRGGALDNSTLRLIFKHLNPTFNLKTLSLFSKFKLDTQSVSKFKLNTQILNQIKISSMSLKAKIETSSMSSRVTRSQYQKFKKFAEKNDIKLKILLENDEKNLKLKKRCDDKLLALSKYKRKLRQYKQLQSEKDKLRKTKFACQSKAWKIHHDFLCYHKQNDLMNSIEKNFTNLMTKEEELCKMIIGQREIIMIQLKNGNLLDIIIFMQVYHTKNV